jgi:hypothetical protein
MKNIVVVFALVLAGNILFAQPKSLNAVRTATPPVIDGFGNDEVWKHANTATGFVQREPMEGEPATQRTEVKVLFDDNNMYIFAMMYDTSPDSIVRRLARRDDEVESDYISFRIDSYHDKQTAFEFTVNASGSKTDILLYDDGNSENNSWDPIWDLETKILTDGWSSELRIPLSQIRFNEGNDIWGINFVRWVSRKQERNDWMLISKKNNGIISQFGTMTGMSDLKSPKLFEVLPYIVGSSEHYPQTSEREKVEKIRPNAGVDIKYGVTSNFTLDATFNPDFAQVEADPAVLNLTTFETFYPEKRPFFIEGTQIIRFVTFGGDFGPGLFYSRRIGRPINVRLPNDGKIVTEEPRTGTILGAAKFSGKTEGGTSIGILTGLTDEEQFSYRDTLGTVRSLRAEPSASYNLFRIKQDFWGNSNIGAIVTGTTRDGSIPAYTGGTDWDIKFDSSNYRVNGFLAVSHGTKFINKFGRVSAQPFMQQGSAGKINIGRVSGDWLYSIGYDFTSKKYFINDIGFFRSPNDYGVGANLTYRTFAPGEYLRSYNVNINPHIRWNYDRLTLFRELNISATAQLINYWTITGRVNYSMAAQDPYEPRGYGVFNKPPSFFVRGEIESDNRKMIIVNAEENYRMYENNGIESNAEASIVIRPTSSMEYELSMGYLIERDLDKFVNSIIDSAATLSVQPVALYGKRDVDGLDLTLRGSILFTHDLSLQIYNQFFWAKGNFDMTTYSWLNSNRNLTPHSYSLNEDFNETSLQTNIVLRWEYREGSTFYFVWSHGRSFYQYGGYNTNLGTNLNNTFLRTSPDNTYVVKMSYWMSL